MTTTRRRLLHFAGATAGGCGASALAGCAEESNDDLTLPDIDVQTSEAFRELAEPGSASVTAAPTDDGDGNTDLVVEYEVAVETDCLYLQADLTFDGDDGVVDEGHQSRQLPGREVHQLTFEYAGENPDAVRAIMLFLDAEAARC